MEPIPLHTISLPPVTVGPPPRDRTETRPDARRQRPGKAETPENPQDNAPNSETEQEPPRRPSDGILGTLIDVEG